MNKQLELSGWRGVAEGTEPGAQLLDPNNSFLKFVHEDFFFFFQVQNGNRTLWQEGLRLGQDSVTAVANSSADVIQNDKPYSRNSETFLVRSLPTDPSSLVCLRAAASSASVSVSVKVWGASSLVCSLCPFTVSQFWNPSNSESSSAAANSGRTSKILPLPPVKFSPLSVNLEWHFLPRSGLENMFSGDSTQQQSSANPFSPFILAAMTAEKSQRLPPEFATKAHSSSTVHVLLGAERSLSPRDTQSPQIGGTKRVSPF